MPIMDGLEAAELINELYENKKIDTCNILGWAPYSDIELIE